MAADRQRFEYKVVKVKPGFFGFSEQNTQELLQQLGKDGWELVNAATTARNYFGMVLFLKRPL